MKERPILFSAPMVRAILEGRKTQTRRVVKHSPSPVAGHTLWDMQRCPYGQPGDRLWVREAWAKTQPLCLPWPQTMIVYREGDNRTDYGGPWKPSIHMPRAASRITLEVTGVRVERLQDISDEDAIAEGMQPVHTARCIAGDSLPPPPCTQFSDIWDAINGPKSWQANPWVWVVEFRRLQP